MAFLCEFLTTNVILKELSIKHDDLEQSIAMTPELDSGDDDNFLWLTNAELPKINGGGTRID